MAKYAHDLVMPNVASDESKKNQIATMFNTIAHKYDFLNRFMSGGIDVAWRKKAILELQNLKPKIVLDVATGTADVALLTHKLLQPTKIFGIDISEGTLNLGKEKIAKLSYVRELMNHRSDDGQALQFQEIFDEIITMIQAGHETSTNSLIWTMLLLSENPAAYQKLKYEMKALPENYQLTELDEAPYLSAVIYESMRLDPPAWAFDRRALEDVDLKSCKIKKGQIR